jgi:GntR family histidine utilization transcriptional repressor
MLRGHDASPDGGGLIVTRVSRTRARTGNGLKRTGNGPVYEQIRRAIADPIMQGRWRPGRRIPSEMELTKSFATSRMTVNRALTALAAEGLIVRWRRRGSFVAERPAELTVFQIWDIAAEVERNGGAYRYELMSCTERQADVGLAADIGVPVGAPLLELTCRHFSGNDVVQLEERLINLAAVPQASADSFAAVAPGRWLLDHVPWSEARHDIAAENADTRTAHLMALARGQACLVIVRRTWQGTTPITLARLVHPGSSYALTGRFRPSAPGAGSARARGQGPAFA